MLTNTQKKIARLVARGYANGRIANELYLSKRTVDFHLYEIYRKKAINSPKRLNLVLYWYKYNSQALNLFVLPYKLEEIKLDILYPREEQVIKLMAQGYGTNDICQILGLSAKTIMHYKEAIYYNFGAKKRINAEGFKAEILAVLWVKKQFLQKIAS